MSAGVVIVGGGHGGSQAAASLRSEGYEGPVTVITAEADIPYQRPPLSKTYLKEPERGLQELRPAAFYEKQRIDLRLSTTVVAVDRGARVVTLAGGGAIPFSQVILATGTRPRIPAIPGADLAGIYYLRDAADARRMHDGFMHAERVVVVGGGFIGLEIAATARGLGRTVTVIEAADRLMGRAVAPEISAHFLALHRGWGTTVLLRSPVAALHGIGGRVSAVEAGGEHIPADIVVIGIGVVPNTELAAAAGATLDNGIVVDERLATSVPHVHAIGDCVSFPERSVGRRMRLESVQNAVDQGKAVAKEIVGKGAPYHAVPWFWSDQGDVKLQMVGLALTADRRVLRGRPDDGHFSVFSFAGERLVAIDSVNRGADHMLGRRVLDGGTLPTPDQAADESFDLKSLIARPARAPA